MRDAASDAADSRDSWVRDIRSTTEGYTPEQALCRDHETEHVPGCCACFSPTTGWNRDEDMTCIYGNEFEENAKKKEKKLAAFKAIKHGV